MTVMRREEVFDAVDKLTARYRPQRFSEVIGQDDAVRQLSFHARSGSQKSLLLRGDSGTGKTTLALILARALLCDQQEDDGSPCCRCRNCLDFMNGDQRNFFDLGHRSSAIGEIADLFSRTSYNAINGKPWIIFLDEAHRLHGRAIDSLNIMLENPGNRIFILSTTDQEGILPLSLCSRLKQLQLEPIGHLACVAYLRQVCEAERFSYTNAGLELLAELCKGSARLLLEQLETTVERYEEASNEAVRRALQLDDVAAYAAYLKALLCNDIAGQLDIDDELQSTPIRKAERIQNLLLDLYEVNVVRRHKINRELSVLPVADRQEIADAINRRAQEYGIDIPKFWLGMMGLWETTKEQVSQTWFRQRIHRLHDYVNGGPATNLPSMPMRYRGRSGGGGDSTALSQLRLRPKERTRPQLTLDAQPDSHNGKLLILSKSKVADVYDAASFVLQQHMLPFNTRISFIHSELGLSVEDAKALVPACMHELGMRVQNWSRRMTKLHYIYLHEGSATTGLLTTVVAHVPEQFSDAAHKWLFDDFLPRWFKGGVANNGIRLRITSSSNRISALRRHWRLVKLLCKAVDQKLTVVHDQRSISLADALAIPSRLRPGSQTTQVTFTPRVSTSINRTARQPDEQGLGFLSSFRDGAWDHLYAGWEYAEYEDRQRFADENVAKAEAIKLSWPIDASERERQLRQSQLNELSEALVRQFRERTRSWQPWWTQHLQLPSNSRMRALKRTRR